MPHNVPKSKKSLERKFPDGTTRAFPTLDDFIAALVAANELKDAKDLRNHPEHYPAIFDAWIQSSQLACIFAVEMATRRKDGWLTIAVEDLNDEKKLHQQLDKILAAPQAPEALSVIFPHLTTAEDVVDLVKLLCGGKTWGWEEIAGAGKDKLLVGLRWMLPAGGSASWVLGFSPYDLMPFTRRAPFTTLVMRTQYSKRAVDPDKLDFVHLADVPPYTRATHTEMWEKTEEAKRKLLTAAEYRIAKAKVSFVLPASFKDRLPPPAKYSWAEQPK